MGTQAAAYASSPSSPIAPPAFAARRAMNMNRPTIRRVAPKPSSRSLSSDWLVLVDFALTSTPFSCNSAESWLPFQNDGTCVANRVLGVAFLFVAGWRSLCLKEQNADLIVVGSCSHGAFGRVMLGDDTRAALNGAPCAVAIAPLGYAERAGGAVSQIAKVGVAYNSSPESATALAMAQELAAPTRATVHALEVVMIPTVAYTGIMAPVLGESIDVMLQEANSRIKELPDVDGHAVYGLAGEELAAFGDRVDLLVVGSRGYGPVKRLVLGSTSDYLERHAGCSLLVLPRVVTGPGEGSAASSEHHAETPVGTAA